MRHSEIKNHLTFIRLRKLAAASLVVGLFSSLLALALKRLTEQYQERFFSLAEDSPLYLLIFPLVGLSLIYLLRSYMFHNKPNKGITEILDATQSRKKNLPSYKIPSHFFNGFLTVIFGGSTGIEVSTVVATATIGSVAQQKANFFRQYKTELICAGVAAGVAALFSSPIAGILFAYEVISRKISKTSLLTILLATSVASALIFALDEAPLFASDVREWHWHAAPYFLVLGILAGLNSVYLTRCVLWFKTRFAHISGDEKMLAGALLLSGALVFFPQLYGDGYHAIHKGLTGTDNVLTPSLALTFLALLILKPIVTSATLASGGDGGVFAPSLFTGAFLGLLTALFLNTFAGADVIPLNFMIVGMAAVLSASIHAPFTALFLVCGLTGNYVLFFPILAACLISKFTAKMIYPYTVYSIKST